MSRKEAEYQMAACTSPPHYWLLPDPGKDVPTIQTCRWCGATGEYDNFIPEHWFASGRQKSNAKVSRRIRETLDGKVK